jgi:uncharacterized membrane protein YqaE (UPF0057 family)
MKQSFTLISLLFILLFSPAIAFGAAAKALPAQAEAPLPTAISAAAADGSKLSKKEKRAYRKSIKKDVKNAVKDWKSAGSKDTETLLLVIIAILLPPLAMALYDGISKRFWISLLLTIIFYIPGLIYTLIVILGGK